MNSKTMGKQIIYVLVLLLGIMWLSSNDTVNAEPIKMQVTGGNIRTVLLSVAQSGKFNIIIDDKVNGYVTLNLCAEPEKILQLLTDSQGLVLTKVANTYIVTEAAKAGFLQKAYVYNIKYADLHDIVQAVILCMDKEGFSNNLSNNNHDVVKGVNKDNSAVTARQKTNDFYRVMADTATNSLIFYGNEREARLVTELLEKLDVPAKQVSLEAKVLALSKDASKNLGIEWEWSKLPQYPDRKISYSNEGKKNERREDSIDRHWRSDESIPGIIQFGHGPEGNPFEFYFSAKLNALVSDGKAKVLARPNITTVQGQEAVINIGGEVPVPTQTINEKATTTTLTYRQAGIILKCKPRVNADGYVTAEVHTEVSSPLYVEDIKAYRFQKRSADTMVRLRDGETMVIGGLIGSEESRTMSKVPFLSKLPVLGAFFRNLKRSSSESELMIFLTARVLPNFAVEDTYSPFSKKGKDYGNKDINSR